MSDAATIKANELTQRAKDYAVLTSRQRSRLDAAPDKYKKIYLKVLQGKASPRQAIKVMCLSCMGWQRAEVLRCNGSECPLHPLRPGTVVGGSI